MRAFPAPSGSRLRRARPALLFLLLAACGERSQPAAPAPGPATEARPAVVSRRRYESSARGIETGARLAGPELEACLARRVSGVVQPDAALGTLWNRLEARPGGAPSAEDKAFLLGCLDEGSAAPGRDKDAATTLLHEGLHMLSGLQPDGTYLFASAEPGLDAAVPAAPGAPDTVFLAALLAGRPHLVRRADYFEAGADNDLYTLLDEWNAYAAASEAGSRQLLATGCPAPEKRREGGVEVTLSAVDDSLNAPLEFQVYALTYLRELPAKDAAAARRLASDPSLRGLLRRLAAQTGQVAARCPALPCACDGPVLEKLREDEAALAQVLADWSG